MTAAPDLSVVLATPFRYETIARTMAHLRAQSARDRLEIVIVAPSRESMRVPATEVRGFWGVQLVEVGSITSPGPARAAGILRACAPVVALAEDHSYPAPGWAAALIAAHRGPSAVVGPAIANGNPGSATSWATLVMHWTAWMAPGTAGVVDTLPWHNSAYKRDLLLRYGPRLGEMLELEGFLHADLRASGHRLYLEPAALTAHVNISRPSCYLRDQWLSGRLFAATRVRRGRWSPLRRLLYSAGAPLIPVLRLWRIRRDLRHSAQRRGLLRRILPALVAGLTVYTVGEVIGYTFGASPDVLRRRGDLEFDRQRFLTDRERSRVLTAAR